MKLHHHTIFSITIAGVLYVMFTSWRLALGSFIAGIFIDVDHIVDVVREHGWSVKVREFFHICHTAQFNRILLLLHGWEWLIIWTFIAWLTDWNPWITGALIGLGHHMVLDAYANSENVSSYSLLWRWKKDFHFDTIFPKFTRFKYRESKYFPGRPTQ